MLQKFWMVWLNDSPTTRRRHPVKETAEQEADRIAGLPENRGKKVYVLESIDYRFVDIPITRVKL